MAVLIQLLWVNTPHNLSSVPPRVKPVETKRERTEVEPCYKSLVLLIKKNSYLLLFPAGLGLPAINTRGQTLLLVFILFCTKSEFDTS